MEFFTILSRVLLQRGLQLWRGDHKQAKAQSGSSVGGAGKQSTAGGDGGDGSAMQYITVPPGGLFPEPIAASATRGGETGNAAERPLLLFQTIGCLAAQALIDGLPAPHALRRMPRAARGAPAHSPQTTGLAPCARAESGAPRSKCTRRRLCCLSAQAASWICRSLCHSCGRSRAALVQSL